MNKLIIPIIMMLLVLPLLVTAVNNETLWYKFDNTYLDSALGFNVEPVNGETATFLTGKVGSYAVFLGGGDSASGAGPMLRNASAPSSFMNGEANHSYAFWVNFNTFNTHVGGATLDSLIVLGPATPTQFNNSQVSYSWWSGAPFDRWLVNSYGDDFMASATALSTGTWYHVVWTYSSSGTRNIYLNGVSEGGNCCGASGLANNIGFTSSTQIMIGGSNNGLLPVSKNANAVFDDVRVYDFTLTQAQVDTLYNSGFGRTASLSDTRTQYLVDDSFELLNQTVSGFPGCGQNNVYGYTTAQSTDGINQSSTYKRTGNYSCEFQAKGGGANYLKTDYVTGLSNMTAAVWVYMVDTPIGNNYQGLATTNGADVSVNIGAESNAYGLNKTYYSDFNPYATTHTSMVLYQFNTWVRLMIFHDGNGRVITYVDGRQLSNISAGFTNMNRLWIGSVGGNAGNKTYYDDFQVWRGGPAEEPGSVPILNGLNTVLKMDETDGTTLINNVSVIDSVLGNLTGFRTAAGKDGWGINYTTSAVNKSATVYGVSGNFSSSRRSTDSIWFKTNTTFTASVSGEFLSYTLSGGEYAILSVGLNTPNKLEWSLYSSGYQVDIVCPNNADDNQWHNAIVTMDGSGNDTLYMDGVLCGSQAHYVPYFEVYPNLYLHTLAPNYDTATDTFWGALDEYYHWNRILNSTEITMISNGSVSSFYPFPLTAPAPPPPPQLNITNIQWNGGNSSIYQNLFLYNITANITNGNSTNTALNVSLQYPNGSYIKFDDKMSALSDILYINSTTHKLEIVGLYNITVKGFNNDTNTTAVLSARINVIPSYTNAYYGNGSAVNGSIINRYLNTSVYGNSSVSVINYTLTTEISHLNGSVMYSNTSSHSAGAGYNEYAMYEPGLSNFNDLTPNGFNLLTKGPNPPFINTTFTKVSGKSYQSLVSGSTKSGLYAVTTAPTGNRDVSYCMWVYPKENLIVSGRGFAVMYYGDASAGTSAWFLVNGGDGYQFRTNGYGAPTPGVAAAQDTWTHVCYAYNASSVGASIYVNGGASIYTGTLGSTPNFNTPGIVLFNAGLADNSTWDSGFVGYMDDVRFYNKTITPADAVFLYNGGSGTTQSLSATPQNQDITWDLSSLSGLLNQTYQYRSWVNDTSSNLVANDTYLVYRQFFYNKTIAKIDYISTLTTGGFATNVTYQNEILQSIDVGINESDSTDVTLNVSLQYPNGSYILYEQPLINITHKDYQLTTNNLLNVNGTYLLIVKGWSNIFSAALTTKTQGLLVLPSFTGLYYTANSAPNGTITPRFLTTEVASNNSISVRNYTITTEIYDNTSTLVASNTTIRSGNNSVQNITWDFDNNPLLPDGVYTYRSWINDTSDTRVANETYLPFRTFDLNQGQPNISIINPLNNSIQQSRTVRIFINATDRHPIDKTWFDVGNSTNYTFSGGLIDVNYTFPIAGVWTITVYSNETSGNRANASSTFLINTHNPTWTPDGKVGGAYQFDGYNDYVTILNITNPQTTSMWYKIGSVWTLVTNVSGQLYKNDSLTPDNTQLFPAHYDNTSNLIIGQTVNGTYVGAIIDEVQAYSTIETTEQRIITYQAGLNNKPLTILSEDMQISNAQYSANTSFGPTSSLLNDIQYQTQMNSFHISFYPLPAGYVVVEVRSKVVNQSLPFTITFNGPAINVTPYNLSFNWTPTTYDFCVPDNTTDCYRPGLFLVPLQDYDNITIISTGYMNMCTYYNQSINNEASFSLPSCILYDAVINITAKDAYSNTSLSNIGAQVYLNMSTYTGPHWAYLPDYNAFENTTGNNLLYGVKQNASYRITVTQPNYNNVTIQ